MTKTPASHFTFMTLVLRVFRGFWTISSSRVILLSLFVPTTFINQAENTAAGCFYGLN